MSNKVRRDQAMPGPDPDARTPVLVYLSGGTAAIRDESRPLPGQRQLASMVHDFRGWTMSIRDVGVYGPFDSAEDAAAWWAAHRGNWPEPPRARLPSDDWPPRE